MAETAILLLNKIRINGRPGSVQIFSDRSVVTTDEGERTVAMSELEKVTILQSWKGNRLQLVLAGGETLEIRRLSPSSVRIAHRTILETARGIAG